MFAGKGQETHVSGKAHAFARVTAAAALCAGFTLFSAAPSNAVTGSVVFTGNISTSNQCSVIVANDGTFAFSADRMVLSSKLPGGSAAVAEVRSNHAYNITAIAVPMLTSFPSGGNNNVTLQSLFSGQSIQNGSVFAEQNGTTAVTLRNGLSRTRVSVNLIATRTGTPYPMGYYQGTVTIRCE